MRITSCVACCADHTQIPSLDTRRPPEAHRDRALVRFRAMVQDTSASSEMYLRRTRSGALGGWGVHDADEDDGGGMEANYAELRECRVLWAVSVPGESAWCADELGGPSEGACVCCVLVRCADTSGQIACMSTSRSDRTSIPTRRSHTSVSKSRQATRTPPVMTRRLLTRTAALRP